MKRDKYCLTLIMVVLLLIIFSNQALSQMFVGGVIGVDTTWARDDSPFVVESGIMVAEGVTLTIEPGVVVKFGSGFSLAVKGTLVAKGTASQPILFTKRYSDNWGYILFEEQSTDAVFDPDTNQHIAGCVLEHCIVEYAGNADVKYSGAVRINSTHPLIHRCTIRNNDATGIQAWNISKQLSITHSTIHNCRPNPICKNYSGDPCGGGVAVYRNSKNPTNNIYIFRNNIYDNIAKTSLSEGGAITLRYCNADIMSNRISNNQSSFSGGGINIYSGNSIIRDNVIIENRSTGGGGTIQRGGGGMRLSFSNALISNNIIMANEAAGSSAFGGGIFFSGAKALISSNVIFHNKASHQGGGLHVAGVQEITITRNSIIDNTSPNAAAVSFYPTAGASYKSYFFNYNTIKNNISERFPGTGDTYSIYVRGFPLIRNNNIYTNYADYELWNANADGAGDVDATINWWGTAIPAEIETRIYDFIDDSSRSFVAYAPWTGAPQRDAPITSPTGFSATLVQNAGACYVSTEWSPNTETNVVGYKVYWDSTPGYPYQHSARLGNVTQSVRRGIKPGTYYFAVTAYNDYYNDTLPNSGFLVNPEQGAGNESWFSNEAVVEIPDDCLSRTLVLPMLFLLLEE